MPPDLKTGQGLEGATENTGRGLENEKEMTQKLIKNYQHRYNIVLHTKMNMKDKLQLKQKKQKEMLKKYQEDRDGLISQTTVSDHARKKEIEFLQAFVDYIREKAFLENETKTIRLQMKELDVKNTQLIRDIKKRSSELIRKKATMSEIGKSADKTDALLHSLENKLGQVKTSLNQVIMTSNEYRREIQDCLAERNKFRNMLDSVTSKLKLGKTCMLDMIQQATVTSAKREFAKDRLKKLILDHKNKTKKQCYQYRGLNNDLNVLIDRAIFQSIKIQRRVSKDLESKKQLDALVKRQNLENQVRQSKLLVNSLKLFYGVENIDECKSEYETLHNVLRSLLTYVCVSFSESDKQHKKNAVLLYTCDQIKNVTGEIINEERNKLEESFNRYKNLEKEVRQLRKQVEFAKTIKEFTILRLNMMFYKAGGSFQKFIKLLGDNTKITENNIGLTLREVERKIIRLIGSLYMVEKMNEDDKNRLPLKRYLLYMPLSEENSHLKQRIFGIGIKTPCPACAEAGQFAFRKEGNDVIEPFNKLKEDVLNKIYTEEVRNRLHSLSNCHLPGSKKMLQQIFLKIGH